jgi:uncharacterized protein YjbI with pentapeptide repeats
MICVVRILNLSRIMKLKEKTRQLRKIVKYLTIPAVMGSVIMVSYLLWKGQQDNVDSLQYKIENFKQQVERVSSSKEKIKLEEKLKLEKDILVIEKDKIAIQNGVYTTLVQLLGGIILSGTAYIGYRNLKVAEDKQVTERFSKAIEHLGNDKIDIRLGGIYALEEIAIDSPKYHWKIIEILSAFVREKCIVNTEDGIVNTENSKVSIEIFDDLLLRAGIFYSNNINYIDFQDKFKVTKSYLLFYLSHKFSVFLEKYLKSTENTIAQVDIDIQAIISILGRRKTEQDLKYERIDLRRVNLSKIEIQTANFNGANLSEITLIEANLSNANLNNVNLIGANLSNANLNNADLIGANLSQANLNKADLIGANLSNANLNSTNLIGANLSDANLRNVNFNNAILLGTKLIGTDLSTCKNLTSEQLILASIDKNTKLPDYCGKDVMLFIEATKKPSLSYGSVR